MRSSIVRSVLFLALLAPPPGARGELVINEVLYDPVGPDLGREFVEIHNSGPYAAVVAGLALEAGDGARPDSWRRIWSGGDRAAIPPGGYYRIGLDGPGAGEAVVITLQNGPDGVRLLKQGFELDRVGWGDLQFPEYYEGRPAETVRAGFSLARAIDGADTDDNRADFVEAAPTPGRPNRPDRDWAIRLLRPIPEIPRPGESYLVRIAVGNRGRDPASPPPIALHSGGPSLVIGGGGEPIDAGGWGERGCLLPAPEETGPLWLRGSLLVADEVPENDRDSLRIRIGTGPLRITEVLPTPASEGSEWIEVERRERIALEGIRLDLRGRTLALSPWPAESGPLRIIAQDSAVVRSHHRLPDDARFWSYAGSWIRLRDTGGAASDTLRLIDPEGTTVEVAIPGPAPARGVSLERREADLPEGPHAWVPCSDPAGATPGRLPGARAGTAAEGLLTIQPRVFRPGEVPCLIEGEIGPRPGRVRLDLVDLRGGVVRCLVRDLWVAGRYLATWDGRDEEGRIVPAGIYIAVLALERAGGAAEIRRAAFAVAPESLR